MPRVGYPRHVYTASKWFSQSTTVITGSICVCVCAHACLTLCSPMNCSPPGSSVHGIFRARILEWGAISYSRGIFPTQGSSARLLCVLRWQADSLPPVLLGSPTGSIGSLYWLTYLSLPPLHLQVNYLHLNLCFMVFLGGTRPKKSTY